MQAEHTVQLDSHALTYTLRKRRGLRRMTLSVRRDGSITLSVPWWCRVADAERYLVGKQQWLTEALARVPRQKPVHERRAHYEEHKEAARVLVHELLAAQNSRYGFSWGRVAIRRNASSWGSCSSRRNLNFDYRILFLPRHLQTYLVVHELCHLAHMNHSPRFWQLVAHAVPSYTQARAELRRVQRT